MLSPRPSSQKLQQPKECTKHQNPSYHAKVLESHGVFTSPWIPAGSWRVVPVLDNLSKQSLWCLQTFRSLRLYEYRVVSGSLLAGRTCVRWCHAEGYEYWFFLKLLLVFSTSNGRAVEMESSNMIYLWLSIIWGDAMERQGLVNRVE